MSDNIDANIEQLQTTKKQLDAISELSDKLLSAGLLDNKTLETLNVVKNVNDEIIKAAIKIKGLNS